MRLWVRFLDLLYPEKCVLCGTLLGKGEQDLCRRCRVEAPGYHDGKRKLQFLDSFAAVWYYEGYVRESILRFKFSGRRGYAKSYGRLLSMKLIQEHPQGFDVVTWVPVSTLRRLGRGYDQSELLAQAVSAELELPARKLLRKIRHNARQSGIVGTAQRRANVLGVYRVNAPESIRGKRILLVDDVLTTGATAGECARMLLMAGAKEVHCAALAAPRK